MQYFRKRISYVVLFSIIALSMTLGYAKESYSLMPTVTSVTPNAGVTGASTNVTIKGANFEQGERVGLLNDGLFPTGSL